MTDCPHCGRPWRSEELPEGEDGVGWVSVARFANLAEAGYVADELRSQGLWARIHERSELDRIAESWRSTYVLQATSLQAELAATAIERLLDAQPEDDDASASLAPPGGLGWRAAALALAAGGLVYVGVRAIDSHRAAEPADGALARVLAESELPLETRRAHGARRLVWYERGAGRIHVDDDFDGDGQADRRRWFPVPR